MRDSRGLTGRTIQLLTYAALAVALACDANRVALLSPPADIAAEIVDGEHGGNPHFFFLPPLAPDPDNVGIFDATYEPIVSVCEWDGVRCGLQVAAFSRTSGTDGETIKVSTADEQYDVNWKTPASLSPGRVYRVRVLAEDTELGHADALVAGGQSNPVDVAEINPGQTLRVKFRIDQGALPQARADVPPAGATVSVPGFARVSFPAGAFETTQPVRVVGTSTAETATDFLETVPVPVTGRGEWEIRINTGSAAPLVPVDVALTIPPELQNGQPTIWVQTFLAGGLDILDGFEPIPVLQYDSGLNEALVQLPPEAFTNRRRLAGGYETVIVIGGAVSSASLPSAARRVLTANGSPCELAELEPPLSELEETGAFNNPTHKGTDYDAANGDPVHAGAGGVVERVGLDERPLPEPDPRSGLSVKGWGRYVRIRHDDGSSTLYGHLIESSTDNLQVGQRVSAGDQIGQADNTGGSTGDHLHVEYRKPDGTPVDPADCMKQALGAFGGTWNGSWSGEGSNHTILRDDWTIEIIQDGTTVSGNVFSPFSGISAPLTGTASGNTLNFSFTAVSDCCWMAYEGIGTLTGTGTMAMSGFTSTSWGETFTWSGTYTRTSGATAAQSPRTSALTVSQEANATTGLVRGGRVVRKP